MKRVLSQHSLTLSSRSSRFDGWRALSHFASIGAAGDDFWQFNVIAGWRFYRNQCEISCGCLNINDTDYKLDPLNPYVELPRSRTLMVRAKISF